MIKYIGSKRKLVPNILSTVHSLAGVETICDIFSGTSRVGHALKREGYRVIANDHNSYAHTLARCYVEADYEDVFSSAEKLVKEFNSLPGRPGYFTETFCIKSRFIQPKNGERIDAIREKIAALQLPQELESVMLVSLLEAADRVDSTAGVQKAYLKGWSKRSYNDLQLRVPNVLPRARCGKGLALCLDAVEAASRVEADLTYVDPPYNHHSYLANYHVWESLVRWDKPETYGIAHKRLDVKERVSPFNSKVRFVETFNKLLSNIKSKYILVSFNNEGFISRETMLYILSEHGGLVGTQEYDHPRYIGAKIGIYNLRGEVVGKVGHLTNKELLYLIQR